MGDTSGIEWTDATWNPTVGCTKISAGCKHCYAETMHTRLTKMRAPKYAEPFTVVRPWEAHLEQPLRWQRPRRIFVNSMSDVFHEDVPLEYIQRIFDVMRRARWHTFQVLTKRASRLAELSPEIDWPANVWMGVSVEDARVIDRIDALRTTGARVKFLSIEPLLGPLPGLDLRGIDWAIVGGESGPGARPMDPAWVREIRDQCASAGVAFFFKQWGGVGDKRGGDRAMLDGRTWRGLPIVEATP
jgi:protein gp37